MIKRNENWGRFVMKIALLGVVVMAAAFAGNRLANARPGVAGGTARTFVTVAGSITGLTGTQSATFHFGRRGEMMDLCAPRVDIAIGAGGAFSVEVPLDEAATPCPETMFNGSDVVVSVDLPGHPGIVRGANVNPVPYAHYASVAGQYGTPDCPVGYSRETDAATPPGRWYCRDVYGDDIVRVGDGPSAFWIDRYEATIWMTRGGVVTGGRRLFDNETDFDATRFPRNGQWRSGTATMPVLPPAYALSVTGGINVPARWVTWFQAQEACRASGKRLPTGEEWLAAAQGTMDPGVSSGAGGQCVTMGSAPRNAGGGMLCRSGWGAQDMIGNVMEWTAEWYAAPVGPALASEVADAWGMDFGSDSTRNVISVAFGSGAVRRVPTAALRGGHFGSGASAGIFGLNLGDAPSNAFALYGFRCVIPR